MAPDLNKSSLPKEDLQALADNRLKVIEDLHRQIVSLKNVNRAYIDRFNELTSAVKKGLSHIDTDDLCSEADADYRKLCELVGYSVKYESIDIEVRLNPFYGDVELDKDDFDVYVSYKGDDIPVLRISDPC